MSSHTDVEIRNYLASNLTRSSFNTFSKLLNIDLDLFQNIMDLLLDYRITIVDISNITDWSRDGLISFINTKMIQNNAYVPNQTSQIDAQGYILNTLGLSSLVQNGSINYANTSMISIFNYTPRVQVGVYDSPLYYKTFSDLQNIFNTSILPNLLRLFNCTTSLTEHFPVTDAGIANLFSSITGTYIVNGTNTDASGNPIPVNESLQNLGISIYKQIFGNLFATTNYLDNSNLIYLFNRVNNRISRLEVECVTFNDLINILIPNQYVFGMANDLAMDLDNKNEYLTNSYITEMVTEIDSLNFNSKLGYSLNRFNFIDYVSKSYYEQNNNLTQYNQGLRDVLDIIIGRVNDFKTLIVNNYDLSNRYLMVL